ncbi:MAG: GIY-YIG nuclease family protein [Patescibacteria group bacterium]
MSPDSVSTFYYVYVLRSKKDERWYTGFTSDLRKRFKEHNNNENTYTKGRGPFELLYYEAYRNKTDARSREKQLKSGQGKAYVRQRMKRFLTLSG